MDKNRREIIEDALKTELGSQVGVGLGGVDAVDLNALASAIDAALARSESGAPHDEGRRPEDLNSSNDG